MRIEDVDGVTTIVLREGGGGVTVSEAGALVMPKAEAVMCVIPGPAPVATFPLSIATELFPSDDHVNVRPFITLLNWSYPTAV